jgi:Rrf2 family cysteine metabolism transcriptional repressor
LSELAASPNGAGGPSSGSTQLTTRTYHSTGAVSFSTEIAELEDLPRAYLEQLVIGLRDADLVRSTRGAHGGYELTRAPGEIRMSDVLRALEGPIAPMICVSEDLHHATCARSGHCTVNFMWMRVRDAIAGALDSMTLADLVPGAAGAVPATDLTVLPSISANPN